MSNWNDEVHSKIVLNICQSGVIQGKVKHKISCKNYWATSVQYKAMALPERDKKKVINSYVWYIALLTMKHYLLTLSFKLIRRNAI